MSLMRDEMELLLCPTPFFLRDYCGDEAEYGIAGENHASLYLWLPCSSAVLQWYWSITTSCLDDAQTFT
jgi:hypothetical protein